MICYWQCRKCGRRERGTETGPDSGQTCGNDNCQQMDWKIDPRREKAEDIVNAIIRTQRGGYSSNRVLYDVAFEILGGKP